MSRFCRRGPKFLLIICNKAVRIKRFIFLILFLELVLFLVLIATPNFVLAQDCGANQTCLDNPLKIRGVDSPGQLVFVAFQGFASLIAVIAIAFTVFSGFKLTIAANEEAIKTARASLTWSVLGFVVSLMTFTIISGTAKFLGYAPGVATSGQDMLENPIYFGVGKEFARTDFVSVMNYLMINFLGIIGIVTTLMIVYYGYRYLTSAGNEQAIEQAKTGLRWAILGFVITILAYFIIAAVRQLLFQ